MRDSNTRSGPRGRSSGSNFHRDFEQREPREMHKAVCSECGQECEVPFEPKEGKPVYCRECYRKKKPY